MIHEGLKNLKILFELKYIYIVRTYEHNIRIIRCTIIYIWSKAVK